VVTKTPFSVSAAVGFISIFVIPIIDGILLNFQIFQLYEEGYKVLDWTVIGADWRFRTVMMTALLDGLGLPRFQPKSEPRRSCHWQSW
jgi:heavy metal efflux system protein